MLKSEHKKLIHKQIILDLAIRTLERDHNLIEDFKSRYAFKEWFDIKIKEATNEKIKVKKKLSAMGTRIEQEIKEDELMTVYRVLSMGTTEDIRYFNNALRNWTNEEIKRFLNIEYRTTDNANTPTYHE